VAGYFLTGGGFDKVAVLQITQEAESDQLAAQTALTEFLSACRKNSMENLVIDVQSNPGGSILLGYDYFKQVRKCSTYQ
jgi:C-terminal processing protease CtpA/Prc